jgi:hypothetical protein
MNLNKLKSFIGDYKNYLASEDNRGHLYKWESLRYFQTHWATEAEDLEGMYRQSLNNTTNRRQWVGKDFFPKEMMLKFIKTEPEYVRLAFRDLFNESKDVAGRVDRFIFYCEELFSLYRERNSRSREAGHYHHHGVVMMYLAHRFPEKYTLYDQRAFMGFLEKVGALNPPPSHDIGRFVKLTRTLKNFLDKDPDIQELSEARLDNRHYNGPNLLTVHELMMVIQASSLS